MQKGQIMDFQGSWGSGIATLVIKKEDGTIDMVTCDNGPTVRALESAFGNIISAGHTADIKNAKGQWIFYDYTDWGTLAGFVPVSQANEEVLEDYERQKAERDKKKMKKVI